jgi:hypothetical protein
MNTMMLPQDALSHSNPLLLLMLLLLLLLLQTQGLH